MLILPAWGPHEESQMKIILRNQSPEKVSRKNTHGQAQKCFIEAIRETTMRPSYLAHSGANLLSLADEAPIPCATPDYKMYQGKGQYLFCLPLYPQSLEHSRCSIVLCFLFPRTGRSCSWADCPSLSSPLVKRVASESPEIDHMLQKNLPEKLCKERTLNSSPAINKITSGFPFGCCFM